MIQAWAYACAARQILDRSPAMNMSNFPKDVWFLHRRLHHRFLKQKDKVREATHELPEYQQRLAQEEQQRPQVSQDSTTAESSAAGEGVLHMVCLLTDSSDDDSSEKAEAEEISNDKSEDDDQTEDE